jgi:hypothetical protein
MADHRKIKNNTYVEILAGTDAVKAKLIMFNDDENFEEEFLVRLRFDEKTNLYPVNHLY